MSLVYDLEVLKHFRTENYIMKLYMKIWYSSRFLLILSVFLVRFFWAQNISIPLNHILLTNPLIKIYFVVPQTPKFC